MSSPSVNVQLVQATVSGAVGQAVAAVQRLQGSVSNQDFVVQLADATQLVVKAGPATELAAEAWACRRLTALGVPVPAVIAVNLDGAELGLPFLILSFVTGSPTEDPGVAREAGRWFRRVHAVKLPGWGPVLVGDQVLGPRAHGRHESWSAAILAELAGVVELVDAGILDGTLAKSACSHVAVDELLAYRDPGVLLHNDLKPAHIFGRADGRQVRLSAVIDWGDATVGDPAADLARLSMAGPTITAAFLDGYGAQLTADLQDRLTRYRILWNLRALTYEYRAGGTWFDTYRDRIRNDTSRLSR